MKVFYELQPAVDDGYFMIVPVHSTFEKFMPLGMNAEGGSYHVLLARILGLSYAQSLRFLRDSLKGKIVGKKGYAYMKYPESSRVAAKDFVKDINVLLTDTFNFIETERFKKLNCPMCGTQRCTGEGEWLEGCKAYREFMKEKI